MKINPDKSINEILENVNIFTGVEKNNLEEVAVKSAKIKLAQGQTLIRRGCIETHAFVLIEGSLRLLGQSPNSEDLFTVGRVEAGEIVGLVDLLRQSPCEAVMARQECKLISIPQEILLALYNKDSKFRQNADKLSTPCEGAVVLKEILSRMNPPPDNEEKWILKELSNNTTKESGDVKPLLSTVIKGHEDLVGTEIDEDSMKRLSSISGLPLRFWNWKKTIDKKDSSQTNIKNAQGVIKSKIKDWTPAETFDMKRVGVREAQTNIDLQGFKLLRGKGIVGANLAILRMISRAYNTPCPIDVIEKILEGQEERAGSIPIGIMGQLVEIMGLQTQIGSIGIKQVRKLELPVLTKLNGNFLMITETDKETITMADPEKGWVNFTYEEATAEWGERIEVILIKKLSDTPQKEFGWGWFTPVIRRFQWPLVQVLLASLFIQLFQLANPLLLQQIIDKVINQSNLSALQVLGAALVAAALFQGLLTAVRTWMLIDTTDRMDLLLGSQVIDKLLRLPLRFFEKRPVGELSQRLGELANLRGFLTGTAITTSLDLLFATIYIIIMFLYSPMLAVVALSTVPIYVGIILFIAPFYRRLIRNQAQYMAKTQSHLIETLSGIQTVKAQHFELNSRWRWQERYSGQIAEGFKSVILGSSTSEIGNFLNQLSSLLIIWVGVYQVVNGEISLGQLIAFRIIAGYVTGPILRLSSLWQGFQQASISMERLSDIVDQRPESEANDVDQISLPPIKGKVKFENLSFRFNKALGYQVDNITMEIPAGSFVGIVGQSGSGKSTLMKLLPRLYDPEKGRILIDNYDISKVSLSSVRQQIGIVPQECLLFEGTIRENITMNNPEADTEDVIKASKAAVAHDFIMDLEDGYRTKLGERGAGLSGGQRQRIAIARTLLANPNLLVLDEATSALDYDTESSVCRNLQGILGGKTVFFITHRLSTVQKADIIILMHQGKIAEVGTHNELMNMEGRYYSLYSQQGEE